VRQKTLPWTKTNNPCRNITWAVKPKFFFSKSSKCEKKGTAPTSSLKTHVVKEKRARFKIAQGRPSLFTIQHKGTNRYIEQKQDRVLRRTAISREFLLNVLRPAIESIENCYRAFPISY
jgi:hypothetical protein